MQPGVFRYADPPYPGLSAKYYRHESSFAGEVDFPALIASLAAARDSGACLGWALSTSARSLRDLLPLCPAEARVCAWVKPINPSPRTYGLHNTWEPVIVVPGRRRRPGKRDWLRAMPARMEGSLPGRKPIAFCAWLFELLGMLPGDTLEDLYPGSGIVSRAWTELSSRSATTPPSFTPIGDASSEASSDLVFSERRPTWNKPPTVVGIPTTAGGRRPGPHDKDRVCVVHAGVNDAQAQKRRSSRKRRNRRVRGKTPTSDPGAGSVPSGQLLSASPGVRG